MLQMFHLETVSCHAERFAQLCSDANARKTLPLEGALPQTRNLVFSVVLRGGMRLLTSADNNGCTVANGEPRTIPNRFIVSLHSLEAMRRDH